MEYKKEGKEGFEFWGSEAARDSIKIDKIDIQMFSCTLNFTL